MKKDASWEELAQYYDERASEYDEVYAGQGPAFPNPEAYKTDVSTIQEIASQFGKGRMIDIACGTGFWLPYYAANCTEITMLDQSERMLLLAEERAKKELVIERCRFVQGNFFEVELEISHFDSAIIGFLLSHLTDSDTTRFLSKLKEIVTAESELMIIDSSWSGERQQYREKEGLQKRRLDDGREFSIFKRYFAMGELDQLLSSFGFIVKRSYFGRAFLALVLVNSSRTC
ncbi:MAG: class I SAM-dependent methyltransferase [Candidatus Thorarchaeota archaeon]